MKLQDQRESSVATAPTQHVRITLAASNLDRAIRFYEKLTGLSESERIGDVRTRFQLDNAELWLMASAAPLASGGAVGLQVRGGAPPRSPSRRQIDLLRRREDTLHRVLTGAPSYNH